MNVGKAILMVLQRQGRTAKWLAAQIPCERTNVYKIFKRHDIDTDLLQRLCVILDHDFFQDLSKETFDNNATGTTDDNDIQEHK